MEGFIDSTDFSSQNLIVVDSQIDNYQSLIADLDTSEIVILDSSSSGIEQITNAIARYDNLDSIHIVSHGNNGQLLLGDRNLNLNNLNDYANEIQSWSNSLDEQADILLYGCQVAEDAIGLNFLQELSQLTNADIAASNDLTGHEDLEGDWDLEVNIGNIEANSLAANNYDSVFVAYNGNEYQLTSATTWQEAQAEAEALGGNLVTIDDAAEQAWLEDTFGGNERLWTGLSDRVVEGEFTWSNGANVNYTNWSTNQPDNFGRGEDFTVFLANGKWNDAGGNANLRGIIEIEPDNPEIFTYNGNQYRLTSSQSNWSEAEAEAEALGGNLVTISDAAEQAWLEDTFGGNERLWTGLTDRATEGQFTWSSGANVNYTNWAPNQPNNFGRGEDFTVFLANGQWNDVGGNANLRGIIEIGADNPTEAEVFSYNGNEYRLTTANLTWQDAQAEAKALGGNLVTINDGAEQAWLEDTFGGSERLWTGLSDRTVEGEFVWPDDAATNFTKWAANQPNNFGRGEDFVAMLKNSQWNDLAGSVRIKGIIEVGDSQGSVNLDEGLAGYWKFNDVSHTTPVADASGNGNNGTNVNIDPGITSYSGPINSAPIFEDFNPRSWNFDGVNDYVSIDNSPELDFSDGQFTQSVWIRPTVDDANYHGILGYQNGAGVNNRAPGLWVVGQTKIHAGFGDGTNWNNLVTDDVLKLNEWNHVVSSFDGTSYKIHVDGTEVFSTDAFAGRRPTNVQRLDIGRVDNYFEGQIDEVRVYNRALNNNEIQSLHVAQPNKAEVGDWSSPIDFPNIAVSAAVLPNGKVVTWSSWDRFSFGGNSPRQSFTSIWDPATGEVGEVLVTNTEHDMFCPGIAMLPDGRLLVNGGGEFVRSTSIYDFETETWSDGADMNFRRWYNSSLTLGNGEVFTLGGERDNGAGNRITTGVGEIWNEATGWRTLSGTPIAPIANSGDRGTEHPQIFLAPNGKVFAAGPSPTMYWYDVEGDGSITEAGNRGDSDYAQVGAAIMYDEGKILTTGGSVRYSAGSSVYDTAYAIDINDENAVTVEKQDPMNYGRNYQTGVVLPNGEVLIVGGEQGNRAFNDSRAVYRPELWNPETGEWSLMDNHDIPRTYHSVALLLPDGRVMAGGGGLAGAGSPVNHPDAEIFTPPYLFNEDGTLAARPVIGNGSDSVGYNESFSISMDTDMPITEFNLVRMSAVTHGVNTDQRFLSVDFTNQGNNNYQLNSPDNGNIAPPGQYMLFAMNDKGVPSEAKIIQIS